MNRIRLSDNTLIDTDEVVFSSKRDDDTRQGVILGSWIPQTFVILRGGCQQILIGEEKVVFDAWAEGERTRCVPEVSIGAELDWRNNWAHVECQSCPRYNTTKDLCMALSRSYPTCHKETKVGVASMCKGCRSYNSETGLCTNKARFRRQGYPDCWGDGKAPGICGTCSHWHLSLACMADGARGPKPDCHEVIEAEAPKSERQRCGNCEWWQTVTHDDPLMPSLTACMSAGRPSGVMLSEETWCNHWEAEEETHHHFHGHGPGSVPHSHGHMWASDHHSSDEADPLHDEEEAATPELENGERPLCSDCRLWFLHEPTPAPHYCFRGYMVSSYPGCHETTEAAMRRHSLTTMADAAGG